jgi:hypothetical protein
MSKPPPPPTGNTRAVTHGAYSNRAVSKTASDLEQRIFDLNPHLLEADEQAVRRYVIAEAIVSRLAGWVGENGTFDANGFPRPAVEHLRRWLDTAQRLGARLGVDPVSRAALTNDVAHTAAIAYDLRKKDMEEGRRLREAALGDGDNL